MRSIKTCKLQPTDIMAIEITIDGTTRTVTKQELLDLAAKGIIGPETTIQVNGMFWKAGQIKDIVFGGAANETFELPDEIDFSPVRSNTTVTGATGNASFSSELKKNCGRIGGIHPNTKCCLWHYTEISLSILGSIIPIFVTKVTSNIVTYQVRFTNALQPIELFQLVKF